MESSLLIELIHAIHEQTDAIRELTVTNRQLTLAMLNDGEIPDEQPLTDMEGNPV